MLDDVREILANGFDIMNAIETMKNNPAGIAGLFLMPMIILGFMIATDFIGGLNNPVFASIGSTPYCQATHYLLINSWNFPSNINDIAINTKCMISNFQIGEFLAYYIELLIPLFIAAIILINVLGL